MSNYILNDTLASNPSTRLPISLCLDVSSSMDGDPINELNRGVQTFYNAIQNDDMAMMAAEINIVVFESKVHNIVDFTSMMDSPKAPHLFASGCTCMGEGVNLSLDLLEKRKNNYKQFGIDYYQPIMVLMTDGQPNGSEQELQRAISRTNQLVRDKKLTIIPIAIGEYADKNVLRRFSPITNPLRLKNLCFKEFFTWLSASVSQVSQTMPDDAFCINMDDVQSWSSL